MSESDSDSTDNDSQESEPERTQTTPVAAAKKPLPKSASKPTPAAAAKKPLPKSASKPTPAAAAKKPLPKSDTSSDSGSSDSDPDSPKSTPIPPQPKSRSNRSAADPVTPAALKRPAAEEKVSKKSKKKKAAPAEPESAGGKSTTKSIIQRKWSLGDELVILQGMVDNPASDATALLDLIKENLDRQDAVKSHLQDKINKLKKKYETNWTKEKEGNDMSFLKPHEHKVYNLSKLVWVRNKSPVEEEAKEGKTETESVWPARMKSIGVSTEERLLMIGDELFASGKAGAEEWKKLRMEGMQTFVRQMEIQTAQGRLVVDLLNK